MLCSCERSVCLSECVCGAGGVCVVCACLLGLHTQPWYWLDLGSWSCSRLADLASFFPKCFFFCFFFPLGFFVTLSDFIRVFLIPNEHLKTAHAMSLSSN